MFKTGDKVDIPKFGLKGLTFVEYGKDAFEAVIQFPNGAKVYYMVKDLKPAD